MKGNLVKFVVGFTIAGIVGGGIYLLLRRKKNPKEEVLSTEYFFDKKDADRMLKEEIEKDPRSKAKVDIQEEIANVFRERYSGGIVRDDDDPGKSPIDINKEKLAKGVREYTQTEEEKRNFEEYMAAMESPEEDDDEEWEEDDEEQQAEECRDIYPISPAQFCNTRNYYDKVSLSYFTDDDVVSDEKDNVMDNYEEVLGNLKEDLEGYPDHLSIYYIRNEKLEIDYEISIVEGSYRHEVLHEE